MILLKNDIPHFEDALKLAEESDIVIVFTLMDVQSAVMRQIKHCMLSLNRGRLQLP